MPTPLDQPESSIPPMKPDISELNASDVANKSPPLAIEFQSAEVETIQEPEEVQKLDLGQGNVVKLDRLGPMIVNTDGTLSRIQNWHELGEIERERTVRLLVKKRNLVRLEKMDEQERAAGRAEGGELSALTEAKRAGE